jgi:hypothetical protein
VTEDQPISTIRPATSVPHDRIGAGVGCLGVIGILMACGLGFFAQILVAVPYLAELRANLSTEVRQFLQTPVGLLVGTTIPGLLPFVLVTTLLQGTTVLAYLPKGTVWKGLLATVVGSVVYWIVIWSAFIFPVGEAMRLFDIDSHLRATEGTWTQLSWVLAAFLLGVAMGAASGAALGAMQFLVLRRYTLGAGKWLLGLVVGNAVAVGSLFAFWLWGTRWGWG